MSSGSSPVRLGARGALIASAASLGLKAATILAKFFVVVYIGRALSLGELGVYGLLVTSVAILVQLLGLDFYVVNTRAILGLAKLRDRSERVRDQVMLHLAMYAIAAFLLGAIAFSGIVSPDLVLWLLVLGIAEHASQEVSRLLVALGSPIWGNVVLFLRMGAWGWVLGGLVALDVWSPSLDGVLGAWAIASFASLLLGLVLMVRMGLFGTITTPVDTAWLRKGLGQAKVFLMATTALYTIHLSDRYLIEHFLGLDEVGIYTFFYSITGMVSTAVTTGVIMIVGPRVVEATLRHAMGEERRLLRVLDAGVLLTSLLLVVVLSQAFEPLVGLLRRPEVLEYRVAFKVLLVGAVAANVATLPYYRLYPHGHDVTIMVASVCGAVSNVLLNLFWIPRFGIVGAAWATAVAFTLYALVMSVGWRWRW